MGYPCAVTADNRPKTRGSPRGCQQVDDTTFKNVQKTGRYRSKFEAEVAQQLDAIRRMLASEDATRSFEYGHEVTCIPYGETYYLPDFTVTLPDGYVFFIEAKGWMPDRDVKKYAHVLGDHCDVFRRPEIDLRFVLQNPNGKAGRSKSTTVAKRIERWGWKWSGKHMPEHWFTT